MVYISIFTYDVSLYEKKNQKSGPIFRPAKSMYRWDSTFDSAKVGLSHSSKFQSGNFNRGAKIRCNKFIRKSAVIASTIGKIRVPFLSRNDRAKGEERGD